MHKKWHVQILACTFTKNLFLFFFVLITFSSSLSLMFLYSQTDHVLLELLFARS